MNLREWALPVYTILVQLATGSLLSLWVIRTVAVPRIGRTEIDRMVRRPTVAILCTIVVALFGAHFHLSRPFLSFLALANIRSSWLSREVLFTTLFLLSMVGLAMLELLGADRPRGKTTLGWFAIGCGTASIFCMSAIYLMPAQPAWNSPLTFVSFYATTFLLGVVAATVLLVLDLSFSEMREPKELGLRLEFARRAIAWLAAVAVVMVIVEVILSAAQIIWLENGNDLAHLSLELLLGLYRPLFVIRLGLLLAGVTLLVLSVWTMRRKGRKVTELLVPAYVSCLFVLIGEILGRFLFYATHIRLGV